MGLKNLFMRVTNSLAITFVSFKIAPGKEVESSRTPRNRIVLDDEASMDSRATLSQAEPDAQTMLDTFVLNKPAASFIDDIHVRMRFDEDGEMALCQLEPIKCVGTYSPVSPLLSSKSDAVNASSDLSALVPSLTRHAPSPLTLTLSWTSADGRVLKASDFRPIKKLGKGGQGTVLLVDDKVTGTRLSMKVIRKKDVLLRHYPGIFQEQYVMKTMSGSAWVLSLLGSFHDSDNFYFLTEYMSGGDLFSKMKWKRKLLAPTALQYAAELVFAIGVLHENRILHRDIKQDNALLDANDHLVLADFGFTKAFGHPRSETLWKSSHDWGCEDDNSEGGVEEDHTKSRCGTRGFMAPEIYYGPEYSYPADIWAAGVTIFMMLNGRFPFGMTMDMGLAELFRRSKTLPVRFGPSANVSEDARHLITWMLEKDPIERPTIAEIKGHPYFSSM